MRVCLKKIEVRSEYTDSSWRQLAQIRRDRPDLAAGKREARGVLGEAERALDATLPGLAYVTGDLRHLWIVKSADAHLVVGADEAKRRTDAGQIVCLRLAR